MPEQNPGEKTEAKLSGRPFKGAQSPFIIVGINKKTQGL
jgi:hypothetical protein